MNDEEIKNWVEKINQAKSGSVDLSRDEDLSLALMNLISLEEHFYFTAMKTNDDKYLQLLNAVREKRKELMSIIVKNPKGEEWCISKHLLAASMRLMEVGTKELTSKREKEAKQFFKHAFELHSLFFALNLGFVPEIKSNNDKTSVSTLGKISTAMGKLLDCCKE